jgi:2-oxoisovalerate dehydrogenase E1 component beta subunit
MFDLIAPVKRVTGYDTPIPLFRLEMNYLPSVARISAGVREVMRYR